MSRFLDLEEQEQVSQIKNFWHDNGKYFIALFVVLALSYSGWTFYKNYQNNQAQAAAEVFDELAVYLANTKIVFGDDRVNVEQVAQLNEQLKNNYSGTVFAQESALLAAQTYYSKAQVERAQAELLWVEGKAFNAAYKTIARYRLAAIDYDLNQYDAALKWLSSSISPAYSALAADLRGDIYLAQGDKEQAIAQYKQAYVAAAADVRVVAQIKLNKLGVDTAQLSAD